MPQKLPFKEIAENTDIYEVAKTLRLIVIKDRADCPICESERAIELVPDTNTFICYSGTCPHPPPPG